MTFEYVSTEEAVPRGGVRMVVVPDVPSPWGEAAKGIFHIEGIPFVAVKLAYDDADQKAWAGQRSGPIVMYESERPRAGWAEILLLAERIAPNPSLIPDDPADRALLFGLAHELCGEDGLGWSRRLQSIHATAKGEGGFPEPVAKYLGRKYGYTPARGEAATARVVSLLDMFAARLEAQRAAGSRYYIGASLTALDVYGATFAAMFKPLPDAVCAMRQTTRATFEQHDDATAAALHPILFEHRDMMYREHLELPLCL